jgi:dTDP-4-amino-4,6-dideoxygalactose transaminase
MPDQDFLMYHRPSIGAAEKSLVLEVLESGWLTTGPKAKELERRFADFRGTSCAVAMNSCTAALHVGLITLGVGPGDEVVTSPMTFASTANVIIHAGATPVFCDVQPDTLNMDPDSLREAVTERTKAVIPVHFGGHPVDMDEIEAVCRPRGIRILEDAAHAVEGEYRGRRTGSLGDAAAFSFYATKNITTAEGGMLTTNDSVLAERARVLSLHGLSGDAWKRYSDETGEQVYEILEPGFKYNMPDLAAALGLAQLDRVDEFWAARERLTQRYDAAFSRVPEILPTGRRDYVKSALHLYVVRLTREAGLSRDALMRALRERGVGSTVHFRPVHLHPYYRERFGFRRGMFPVAEEAGDTVVSLPLFPAMSEADADRVVQAVVDSLGA